MNILLHLAVVFSFTSLPLMVVCLDPVSVQFQKSPVLVASGNDAIFTVQTVSNVSLIRWTDSGDTTLAMWANGSPVVIAVPQYQGRVSVSATQLTITNSQIRDSGNYTASVEPLPATGLGVNAQSVQLKVFDAVSGVTLSLPSLPVEGGNVSLSCSWSAGTEVSVVWGKGGNPLSSDSHMTINAGSLFIQSASRNDAGDYTCTVINAVSAQTAKASLTIYYGPDAPQLSKTSSQCVGGGDATVGQTVLLTCTSTSLPPASFSWELNGQPVTSGQTGTGTLSLQIFSTNQSGTYVCIAHNDVTGGTSKQQIDLAIVGTCLSGGAVAGIVVACVVALIIIIVVIIVLLRQRNIDRRLRDTIELQKTNQNEGTTIANRAFVNENHPDPTQNFSVIPDNNNRSVNTMVQNMPTNSNGLHHNGHLNADVFQHNFRAVPDNGHPNNNSYPNNDPQRSFPQQNPNILIQTGSSQPGALAPTVHVNLNTLPRTDQFSTQPQTVHVNLNTFPPESNQVVQQHARAPQSQHTNANHHSPSQTGLLNSNPSSLGHQTQTMLNNVPTNVSHQPNGLIQTGYSHPVNQTNTNSATASSRSSGEQQTRHSNHNRTSNQFNNSSTHLQQMPWDRLRGTPAYPNHETDSSDTSGSSDREPRSPQPHARRGRFGWSYLETDPLGRLTQAASAPQRRDLQIPIMTNHSQMDPNMIQQSQVQSQIPRHTLPQTQPPQGHNPVHTGLPLGTILPQTHPQVQTGTRPNEAAAQPFVTLTEAALRQHTAQTDTVFANRIQQTQAALQNPGPSQPVQQLNKAGQKPPTPPQVLQPGEFQTFPRERMQQPRNIQPVIVQRRHRSPNAHRPTHVRHMSPQRMPGMHPMHGHPAHMRQVHRGRPRH